MLIWGNRFGVLPDDWFGVLPTDSRDGVTIIDGHIIVDLDFDDGVDGDGVVTSDETTVEELDRIEDVCEVRAFLRAVPMNVLFFLLVKLYSLTVLF